jgi:uncharacterized membrane protein
MYNKHFFPFLPFILSVFSERFYRPKKQSKRVHLSTYFLKSLLLFVLTHFADFFPQIIYPSVLKFGGEERHGMNKVV